METRNLYKEIKQTEPTTLTRFGDNKPNKNYIGITLMALTLGTTAFGYTLPTVQNGPSINLISNSYTNFEISKTQGCINLTLADNLEVEDYSNFAVKPLYTKEFKIKVKSFKIEKNLTSLI